MSFVLPKPYMLTPLINWGNELLRKDSLTARELDNYQKSALSHGLGSEDVVESMLSKLNTKVVDSSLSDSLAALGVASEKVASEQEAIDWSEYDKDNSLADLKSSDVSEHLEHVDTTIKQKIARKNVVNTRRSGRMRC